jgi:hypothetical protein
MTTYQMLGNNAEVVPAAYPNLWRVTNCFDSETFDWMSRAVLNHNNQWHRPKDCIAYRFQLTPESETHRRADSLWNDLTDTIKEVTGLPELIPITNKFWLDLPCVRCDHHSDSDFIAVTYQVYLQGYGTKVSGTSFCKSSDATVKNPGNQIEIPFVPNTGYINLNTDQKIHYVKPAMGSRLSVCWQWSTIEWESYSVS